MKCIHISKLYVFIERSCQQAIRREKMSDERTSNEYQDDYLLYIHPHLSLFSLCSSPLSLHIQYVPVNSNNRCRYHLAANFAISANLDKYDKTTLTTEFIE
ncbi:hypothetical protein Tcan_00564, partial [Toxocara canis]